MGVRTMIYIIVGIIALIGIGVGLCVFFYKRKDNRHRQFVIENSVALKKLDELNCETHFFDIMNLDEYHTYDNRNMYNEIYCVDYLIYQLQFEQKNVLKQIAEAEKNRKLYEEYRNKVEQIHEFDDFLQPTDKLNKKKLSAYVEELFKQKELHPQTSFRILVVLHCANMHGRILDSKHNYFDAAQIKQLIKKLNNKSGGYYYNCDIWNSICRVERGKVSNRMRFSIYKRDGYRCRICGRREDEVDLEIDHIKPIAKGGKSTYDNLQTLCHRCNKEKGDKY